MPFTSTLTPPLARPDATTLDTAARRDVALAASASLDTRRWCTLAVGSLVIAGLLSLAVVVGRLPVLSRIIDDPLFFKRCLVVHVDLALVVWFYAFLAGLLALGGRRLTGPVPVVAFALSVGGVVAMLAGALMRGAQPILANYVPVIDHPLFSAGLAAFFLGTLFYFIHALAAPAAREKSELPADAEIGLQAAGIAIVIAAATWVSARAGLPDGLDTYTRAEFLAWGPGHVLQAANACAMLAVWLWLLERTTGSAVLSRRGAQLVFGALVLPQAVMPLLTARGTLDALYHTGATQLMRWAIFPAVLVVFAIGVAHLVVAGRTRRPRRAFADNVAKEPAAPAPGSRDGSPEAVRPLVPSPAARTALAGFTASAALALLGLILGACIRGSTTLVPAHYHASLGAVTVAFMTAAYFVCDVLRRRQARPPLSASLWRAAKWQLSVFGVGQTVFALGFALGGAYGLGRKAYAAEQHVRSAGEFAGLIVMGLGGLVAVVGGLWFLFLLLREIHGWWHPRAGRRAPASPPAPELTLP